MGVELQDWVATLEKYPRKFKFDGLDGFHTDVREACVADQQFMDNYMEDEAKSIEENILDYVEPYIDHLIDEVDLRTCGGELLRLCRDPGYDEATMLRLESEVGEHRYLFACSYTDAQFAWECIRENDPESYFVKHPPVEIWNEAYSCGFPVGNVVYFCPSCSRQAMTLDELKDNGFHHYCSLCGSEYLTPHDFRKHDDLKQFAEEFGVELWPLRDDKPTIKEAM